MLILVFSILSLASCCSPMMCRLGSRNEIRVLRNLKPWGYFQLVLLLLPLLVERSIHAVRLLSTLPRQSGAVPPLLLLSILLAGVYFVYSQGVRFRRHVLVMTDCSLLYSSGSARLTGALFSGELASARVLAITSRSRAWLAFRTCVQRF